MSPPSKKTNQVKERKTPQKEQIGSGLKTPENVKKLTWLGKKLELLERQTESVRAAKVRNEKSKETIKQLRDQNKKLEQQRDSAREERDEVSELGNRLRDDLFKKQPKNQSADSDITDEYTQLQRNITSWVDSEIRRYETEWSKNHDGKWPELQIFRAGRNQQYASFLEAGHTYGGDYLVESRVHFELQKLLACDDKLLMCLDQSHMELLSTAERGLETMDPPRDFSTIRYLRSELLKGLAATHFFHERKGAWLRDNSQATFAEVAAILPEMASTSMDARLATFREQILEPAFSLAIAMQSSSAQYQFSEPMSLESQCRKQPLKVYSCSASKTINIDTKAETDLAPVNVGDGFETVATRVLVVAPGIVKLRSGQGTRRLMPDLVCIKLLATNPTEVGMIGDDTRKSEASVEDFHGPYTTYSTKKRNRGIETGSPVCLDSEDENDAAKFNDESCPKRFKPQHEQ